MTSTDAPGLYVHIPFCAKICPYCDFAVARGNRDAQRAFVGDLIAELSLCAGSWGVTGPDAPASDLPAPFDTIYFGGGTPSILLPDEVAEVIDAARQQLPVAPDARITLEANPEDASPARLRAWRQLGVHGISFGVQSFASEELRFLGRRHSPETAQRAVEEALAQGFDWVSVDLIYGLPQQSLAAWRTNLERAVQLAPHHLSCYQLTVHDGTPFQRREQRGRLTQLPDAAMGDFFHTTHDSLAAHGYPAYEVSNFARTPADRSRHNQKYWHHTPYLGVGPSAHSFDGGRRWWNLRDVGPYRDAVQGRQRPVAGEECLTREDRALEEMMLGLRTAEGLDRAGFRDRHGVDVVDQNRPLIDELQHSGLLTSVDDRLQLSTAGLAVVDGIVPRLSLRLPPDIGVR